MSPAAPRPKSNAKSKSKATSKSTVKPKLSVKPKATPEPKPKSTATPKSKAKPGAKEKPGAKPKVAAAPGAIRVGISGWRYEPWRGAFYPEDLTQKRELEYASRALPTIEINGSFYSLQRPSSYASWYEDTPPGFVFSVKAPRYIMQILRSRDVVPPLANFFASGVANLREKLGPILWQFPPFFKYDPELMDRFLSLLPHDTDEASALARRHDDKVAGRAQMDFGPARALRHAIEVRNETFVDPAFAALLRKRNVAWVIADTAGRWPEYEDITSDFVYIRLHGDEELYTSNYIDKVIARWAKRLRLWSDGAEPPDARRFSTKPAPKGTSLQRRRDVFCYFDNTAKVHAPANARRLLDKLGVVWP